MKEEIETIEKDSNMGVDAMPKILQNDQKQMVLLQEEIFKQQSASLQSETCSEGKH